MTPKNLIASSFFLPRQILKKHRYVLLKALTFADCQGEYRTLVNYAVIPINVFTVSLFLIQDKDTTSSMYEYTRYNS